MENTELQLVVSSAQGTVEQNRLSLENANKAADKLIALIEETEIQDNPLVRNLDEQCKFFLAKASKTAQTMSERRKPITQAFDQIRKYFTEMENSLKSGEKIKRITDFRNDFARFLATEEAKAAEEKARQANIAQEKIDLAAWIKKQYADDLVNSLETAYNKLDALFNSMELSNTELIKEQIRTFDTQKGLFAIILTDYPLKYITLGDGYEILNGIVPTMTVKNEDEYKKSVLEKIQYYLDRIPSKKEELLKIAQADKEEKERLRRESEERARAEAEKRKQELLNYSQSSQEKIESATTEATLQNLFDADYSVPSANVKKTLKIEVLNPAGYGQIFMFWFEREGKNLSNEKIEKMTVARMKKFCEDAANKNGEIIDSNTIKYIEVVTAK